MFPIQFLSRINVKLKVTKAESTLHHKVFSLWIICILKVRGGMMSNYLRNKCKMYKNNVSVSISKCDFQIEEMCMKPFQKFEVIQYTV